ncbi:fructose-bisphosphatase class III [Clostridium perfringens]|uniref:fructose-bisphosphatase class III n=1 Tax=Clostridium perfringens TaxID=1502 RepID=UPI002342356D|nr:fructose-bisphosphatase class III [Clostridium perfringens]MDC4245650.1 fructose-bisphosphatase class III [Clostridium perfringens]
MSTYVMSDIHGNYTKFLKMLKLINFQNDDELYILGDIFDRGKQPFNILGYILKHKNIHLLQGNHEGFLIDYVDGFEDGYSWHCNGGFKTYTQFNMKTLEQQQFIYQYLKSRPKYVILKDKYILSHAGIYIPPNGDSYELETLVDVLGDNFLWHRYTIDKEKPYRHYIQICGHNRVQSIEEGRNTILHRNGIIYIDCGIDVKGGQLGCLRLDNMKEYYV